jgi:hypothetical protein
MKSILLVLAFAGSLAVPVNRWAVTSRENQELLAAILKRLKML